MNYEETLEKIHSYHAFGKKPGLERITELMRILGNPQNSLSIIHVAGTNGKGSVCRYLYCVLEQAGYACGLYTSPYLERFTERVQFHGSQIAEEDLIRFGVPVFAAADRMQENGFEEPTEFDIITAIAFLYFAEKQADYVILEVGLGGRGDSTNVVSHPLATVITSISPDHMAVLGNTLTQIAWEKAGIAKPAVPLIYAVKDWDAAEMIRAEASKHQPPAPLYDVLGTVAPACVSKPRSLRKKLGGYCFTSEISGYTYDTIELSMTGMHQVENALCALTVLELLRSRGEFDDRGEREDWLAIVRRGMKEATQPGRFEIISHDPVVILDGAHNEDGIRSLCRALEDHFAGKKILLVLGILRDKAVERILEELKELRNSVDVAFVTTEPDSPRKMGAEELACALREALGADCREEREWRSAMKLAEGEAHGYDAVVFAGSLYLIGSIREGWRKEYEKSITGV
ncbi:MAG: bifunctional folylpolyglutamate synthase/dihydrofolate synthase [Firmicutes bacterium]|nr:bifunctional folylpolyglutamate synthase/dihydrofolate synthase [Bacillota bacterium]